MKGKYYTPEIEEFHVGFECEIESSWGMQKGTYPSILMEDTLTGLTVNKLGETEALKKVISGIRVKHLDGSDIESLGFYLEYPESKNSGYINRGIYEDGCCGIDLRGGSRVGITRYNYPNTSVVVLTIKNKSELKRLLKQMGI